MLLGSAYALGAQDILAVLGLHVAQEHFFYFFIGAQALGLLQIQTIDFEDLFALVGITVRAHASFHHCIKHAPTPKSWQK